MSEFNAKFEEASNLVAFRIANVPVTMRTFGGVETVDADRISYEIYLKTHQFATQVRPHGTCRPGAPYRNWKALFARDSAPRAGFRILDESVVAAIHKPRRPIEQCKRCLGFHATRGCSRAPACRNCGSNMHSEDECKAHTKCRNCGGPVTKEQLAWTRHIEQGKFAGVGRARAAAKRAEETIIAAAKDVSTAEATGFGVLESEEEA